MYFLHGSIASKGIVQLQHLPHLCLNSGTEDTDADMNEVRHRHMAITTQIFTNAQSGLGTRFNALVEAFQQHRAKRRVFRDTYAELSALSNRDLADLGLARSEISRLAWQAANDQH